MPERGQDSEIQPRAGHSGWFLSPFDRNYMSKLDDGEAESLTYMLVSQPGNWRISSSDAIVFRVLGNLNEGEKGISLEEMLIHIIRTSKDLKSQFKKEFRDKYTREAQMERVRGLGLRRPLYCMSFLTL
jgi:hypothetical protein